MAFEKKHKSEAIGQLSRVVRCFQTIITISNDPATQAFMKYEEGLRV